MRPVRTISREGPSSDGNPQRLHARQGRKARKIQSELHGDMQSQAEMTWPSSMTQSSLVREDRDEQTSGVSVVVPTALLISHVWMG